MAFSLGALLLASVFFINAIAVLNEKRFLQPSTREARPRACRPLRTPRGRGQRANDAGPGELVRTRAPCRSGLGKQAGRRRTGQLRGPGGWQRVQGQDHRAHLLRAHAHAKCVVQPAPRRAQRFGKKKCCVRRLTHGRRRRAATHLPRQSL